jgi:class 3 adenylate cyclase/tetratricopeptide (TPR) repeat protein
VLFCDLVGSTALASRLDLEDYHDVLAAYQRRATDIVQAAGGIIARYEGDGILAYFGYPVANEDDAERAVNSGLELVTSINEGLGLSVTLNVRVGIATGVVVVSDPSLSSAADQPPIVGDTPNLAARLQDLAAPNTVVIASVTQRLVGGFFEYRELGTRDLKGFAHPVPTWQVLGRSAVSSRFEALRSMMPLIGRERELQFLLERWQRAKTGNGGVVIILGEPGMGKSRLKLELLARLAPELPVVRRYYCSPRHKDSMLFPLLAQLQRAAMLDTADTREIKLEKLGLVTADGTPADDFLGLLGELMGIPAIRSAQPDARRMRRVLFEAIRRRLEQIAQQRPVVITVEDIQWLDPSSRALLAKIVPRISRIPVFMILTSRSGEMPSWVNEPHVSMLELDPVDSASSELLTKQIAGQVELPDVALKQIVARADGVPLFIEELTKATLEVASGVEHALVEPTSPLPKTLQAALTARLDRLGSARDVARIAAVIGREFRHDLLHAVLQENARDNLHQMLRQLITAELIAPVTSFPAATFAFRHALIQDAAYASLLRGERKKLHSRVAEVLQLQFRELVEMQPEVLAWHLSRAELFEQAIRAWLGAGTHSGARGAFSEAVAHLTEGLKLVRMLPATSSRARRELELQLALGPAIMATRGYAAAESLAVYSRAAELVTVVGTPREEMDVLLGLYNVHFGRADLNQAMATAVQNLRIAEREHVLEGRAYTLLGQTHAAMGSLAEARGAFEAALGMFARVPELPEALGVFASQHVISWAFLAGVYYALGEPKLAQAAMARSIDRARELRHTMSMALALVTDLLTPIPGGLKADPAQAEEGIRFCQNYGLSNFEAWARFAGGAIEARRGDACKGIATMQSALEAAEAMNSWLFRPIQYATLASAHAKLGRIEEAVALVEQAIKVAAATGERRADAALHRLLGDLLREQGKTRMAQLTLMRGAEIARTQGMRSEEARINKILNALPRLEN